ncbi:sigma-70 family RNA polymerase sigma factor [Synergistaceae bacterium OttesenSCG-928-D05]|nr:sigma-70 family RNA polymerase sigma factor [Synergistaceae bacterium OttesenSCG-928-D05]
MNGVVLAFTPLVLSLAKKYQGEGVEFDDLVQTGYLGVLEMAAKSGNLRWLALELKTKLPRYMERAAGKMRLQSGRVEFDVLAKSILDEETLSEVAANEIKELLQFTLNSEERVILQALNDGYRQRELAEIMGISQPAVAQRVGKIRGKMRRALAI